jgi:hypothetical protein
MSAPNQSQLMAQEIRDHMAFIRMFSTHPVNKKLTWNETTQSLEPFSDSFFDIVRRSFLTNDSRTTHAKIITDKYVAIESAVKNALQYTLEHPHSEVLPFNTWTKFRELLSLSINGLKNWIAHPDYRGTNSVQSDIKNIIDVEITNTIDLISSFEKNKLTSSTIHSRTHTPPIMTEFHKSLTQRVNDDDEGLAQLRTGSGSGSGSGRGSAIPDETNSAAIPIAHHHSLEHHPYQHSSPSSRQQRPSSVNGFSLPPPTNINNNSPIRRPHHAHRYETSDDDDSVDSDESDDDDDDEYSEDADHINRLTGTPITDYLSEEILPLP